MSPRRRSRFVRGQGRRTTWATVTDTFTLAAANDYATVDLLSQFKADGGVQQAVTVTRTHLLMSVTSAVAAGDNFVIGLIRGQNADVGNNVVGAPVPDLDPYDDWLLWQWRWACSMTGAGACFAPGGSNVLEYDLKAQRKLEELQMNYNLVVKVLAAATLPLTVQVTGRVLLLLP